MDNKKMIIIKASGEEVSWGLNLRQEHREFIDSFCKENGINYSSPDHITAGLAIAKEGNLILLNGRAYWLFILPEELTDAQKDYLNNSLEYIQNIELLRVVGYTTKKLEYNKKYRDFKIESIINNTTEKDLFFEELGKKKTK